MCQYAFRFYGLIFALKKVFKKKLDVDNLVARITPLITIESMRSFRGVTFEMVCRMMK